MPGPKPKYAHLIPEMVRLREEGKSLGQLSKLLGIPVETIRNTLHRAGVWKPLANGHIAPVDFSHIDPFWWAEFRGFFYGEGSVYFRDVKTRSSLGNPTSRRKLVPVLQVALRSDDRAILEDFHTKLGGQIISYEAYKNHAPRTSWHTTGWSRVYNIIPYLIENALPAKKVRELVLMKEACELRFSMSRDLSEEERAILYQYHYQIRELKLFRC